MPHGATPSRRFLRTGAPLVVALAISLAPATALARTTQGCMQHWTRPVACSIRLSVETTRGRWRHVRPGRRVEIPAGASIVLHAEARDQDGWRFPEDRLIVGLDIDPNCGDALEAHRLAGGDWRIAAGARHGRCRAVVWVPGNLNLDRKITFEIVSRARAGYTRDQARFIARSLYLAILGREPDREGLGAATAEIQRGRIASEVKNMFASPEFAKRRRGLRPSELLDSIYEGLLGRSPDSAGVRTYLRDIERGRSARVVLKIIRSDEFEARLLRRPAPVRRHGF
ncbi:MAG: DUF4214 domain-containing protein [Acidobacteria bacterium]|nr:DUF4214 domain-containing protein [Acidobacteriota bacterium]